ncbi:hypothetical protein BJ878DRAFT_501262 [Calycina marina]|uniref:Secreted protein n=1 Tax=Calycina marina TaxID=1763456 RepID=A0A9P7Z5W6_9HELO|nr:hypothetical protein BJ878DRAFT_501262 [Calycina marina]
MVLAYCLFMLLCDQASQRNMKDTHCKASVVLLGTPLLGLRRRIGNVLQEGLMWFQPGFHLRMTRPSDQTNSLSKYTPRRKIGALRGEETVDGENGAG